MTLIFRNVNSPRSLCWPRRQSGPRPCCLSGSGTEQTPVRLFLSPTTPANLSHLGDKCAADGG